MSDDLRETDELLDIDDDEMGFMDDLPWDTHEMEEIIEEEKDFD